MSSFTYQVEVIDSEPFRIFFTTFSIGMGALRDFECCGETSLVISTFIGSQFIISAEFSLPSRLSRTFELALPIHFWSFALTPDEIFRLLSSLYDDDIFWTGMEIRRQQGSQISLVHLHHLVYRPMGGNDDTIKLCWEFCQ